MSTVIRPVGYVGALQQIIWGLGTNIPVTAYLWGGGGGGGGRDTYLGGSGTGGGFTQVNFIINSGDVLQVGVGGPGKGGASGNNAAGGTPGSSYTETELFNTRTASTSPAVFPQFNSRYCTFLNNYGVWVNPSSAAVFDRSYSVDFPITANYQFVGSADNSADFYIDDVRLFTANDYQSTFEIGLPVPAGTRTLRIVGQNTGGPGAVALTISSGDSFGGGRGGNSGTDGSSGAGGGGGGATVVILNGTVLAAAGGGGGGGGGGNRSGGNSAPGTRGQAAVGDNAGQNGQNRGADDGAGAGGGGGGWGGGNGGSVYPGDNGGEAGVYGLSSSPFQNPNGPVPGGTTELYYSGTPGYGGEPATNGTSGYAVFVFDIGGIFVHYDGSFQTVSKDWVKVDGTWQQISATYVKQDGVWYPVISSFAPPFESISGNFGINPRGSTVPDPVTGDPGGGGVDGGQDGGGGGGGECFTAGTLITMYDGTSKAIDQIIAGDLVLDALTGKPNKVIGIKSTEYEIGRRIFATQKGVTPFITEQHAFYNDQNELCAISEECEYLAPWLGQIKIVDVPEIIDNDQIQTVYNLMFETGNSHYANGVKVSNMVGTGNTYVLFMKGYLDQESYLGYIYHLENTVGLNTLTQEQKSRIYNIMSWVSNYVLHNNNIRSWMLAKTMSWAIRNRTTLYPYIEKWLNSRLRNFIFGNKK